ncbi:hypothetical protein [Thalassovita sp.]|uniref:hypothetical protein n=1 Tax=Thalassovita sp. TaxID=1979401 RepID=UPI002B26BF49|nr:hypothetical protein [Thalassovita sp.]
MFAEQTWVARTIWALLFIFAAVSLIVGRWYPAFVALATLGLSLTPLFLSRWANVVIPPSFIAAATLFAGSTLLLGEAFDFYDRFWWWDIVMHGTGAVGVGLIGFVLIFIMFQGDKYAAPPYAVALFAFCFAMAVGTMWEIFEFTMDSLFGFNTQKSGLQDTMGDLIVDGTGAIFGAGAGWFYLKSREHGGLTGVIDEFVRHNPRLFQRWRK